MFVGFIAFFALLAGMTLFVQDFMRVAGVTQ
jgi:hypothetical protein